MSYKSQTSIRKWHIRHYLDKHKERWYKDYVCIPHPIDVLTDEIKDVQNHINLFKCLALLKLGSVERKGYKSESTGKINVCHIFSFNQARVADFYVKFSSLPEVILLEEKGE